ncbi:hypothetical protein OKC48_20575 [Methylorubrum extorquens]|uniref:hypothetical protein n=1 Tax=Methylorubrum extorquens TaxID=408 RepID=UPI0022390B87|nr:hypothetical protein [Methylorubrum extorquens]UYW25643.1 hypothetical protein OKC48_20575 [Methylorubrum extorquens]
MGVAVNDCLVFAADSASSLVTTDLASGSSQIANVFSHGEKVYNLYKRLPIVAMTCGMGNVGTASIATLAKDLRRRMMGNDPAWAIDRANYTLADVADKARRLFFDERYQALNPPPPAPHSFEFWIGGYSSDFDAGHEVWKISIENGNCPPPEKVVGDGNAGLFYGGQPGPINRLVIGFDHALADILISGGIDPNASQQMENFLRQRLESQLVWPTMPVRDAIDLADFLVETTKRYFRFLPGADIVGGDTDIAVVTKYEGFKWIRRKHFYPASLNPLETDHA